MYCRKLLRQPTRRLWLLPTLGIASMLTACLDESSDLNSQVSSNTNSTLFTAGAPIGNQPPSIDGVPQFLAPAGNFYSFSPNSADVDNDRLTFAITNKPRWATFDPRSGSLSGTPTDSDIGASDRIRISVSDGKLGDSLPSFNLLVTKPVALGSDPGTPITIGGTPPSTASVGEQYWFQPSVNNPNGDALFFAIANQPAWMNFDTRTGVLSGMPGRDDVGTYIDIMIAVSDGTNSLLLSPFSVQVQSAGLGIATLSWQAPTQYEDGSPLNNLAGYKIRYGSLIGSNSTVIDVNNPSITTYVVDGLAPGTYYFATSAYTADGTESRLSNEIEFTVL